MLPIVAGHDKIEIEADRVEHRPVVDYSLDRLFVGQGRGFADLVTDHRIAHQLIGQCEVALVPDNQVVQLNHFTGRTRHTKTSSASMAAMAATARSVSVRQS